METINITKCEHKKDLPKGGKVYSLEWIRVKDDFPFEGECFKEVTVGKKYEAEITETEYGLKVKFPNDKKPWNGGKGYQKQDEYRIASFSMAYAKDIVVGSWNKTDVAEHKTADDLPQIAQLIFDWIKEHKI